MDWLEASLVSKDEKDEWLETIMEKYGENLTRISYSYLRDWGMAEEVVQDVFVKIYKQYDTYEEIGSFKSWIYRITINRCKDVLRSSLLKRVVVQSQFFQFLDSKEKTPEAWLVTKGEDAQLVKGVLTLPVKYREVILLFYFEEMSNRENGNLLGLNENTVKTRLSRGREKLRGILERSEFDGR